MSDLPPTTRDLLAFIEASPTPWHAVAAIEQLLDAAGYTQVHGSDESWPLEPGSRGWITRAGASIIAFRIGQQPLDRAGLRVIGAHTDSPNLRLKPRPDRGSQGYATLNVEPYGGVLLHTWTDRDLSVAGRVSLRAASGGIETRLVRIDRPLCRIPNLAIHLDRTVNKDGLRLNEQDHLAPVWALADDSGDGPEFTSFLAGELGVGADQVLGAELCLFDLQAPSVSGFSNEFVHAPRLDNLACCHAAISALLASDDGECAATAVVALYDHEEIGSLTSRGAASSFTRDVLTRLTGGSRKALSQAVPSSLLVSADMAHAVHPNYADKHDGEHRPLLNGGPVPKTHSKWRYATDAEAMAIFRGLCQDGGIPLQEFASRSDMPCGTTIGPIIAADLGIRAVDVGSPMLSMHSVREMGGSQDPPLLQAALEAVLRHAAA